MPADKPSTIDIDACCRAHWVCLDNVKQQLWWYIDYRHLVDVVRYKLHEMRKVLEQNTKAVVVYYECPECGATYDSYSVGSLLDVATGQLLCENCKNPVMENDKTDELKENEVR